MSEPRRDISFTVWNVTKERNATKDEIEKYAKIIVIDEHYGLCKIEIDPGFSLLLEE